VVLNTARGHCRWPLLACRTFRDVHTNTQARTCLLFLSIHMPVSAPGLSATHSPHSSSSSGSLYDLESTDRMCVSQSCENNALSRPKWFSRRGFNMLSRTTWRPGHIPLLGTPVVRCEVQLGETAAGCYAGSCRSQPLASPDPVQFSPHLGTMPQAASPNMSRRLRMSVVLRLTYTD
jgi:hypothetical protein